MLSRDRGWENRHDEDLRREKAGKYMNGIGRMMVGLEVWDVVDLMVKRGISTD